MSPGKHVAFYAQRLGRRSHRLFAALVAFLLGTGVAITLSIVPALLQKQFDGPLFIENLSIFEPFALTCSVMSLVTFPRRPKSKDTAEKWVIAGCVCVMLTIAAISALDASRILARCIVPLCNQPRTDTFAQRFGAEVFLVCITTIFLLFAPWVLGGIGGFVIWRFTRVGSAV